MEINTDFVLPLPPDPAYALLLDLERVTPCMPGAVLGAEREDGSREVSVAVRLGPMKFNYGGTVRIAERDDASRRAVLVGDAKEKRGQGSARATITMTVAAQDDSRSRVDSTAVFELTGRAAQTGRGIVEDVARRMVSDMAACLAAKTEADAPADAAPSAEPDPAAPTSAPTAPRPSAAPRAGAPVRGGSLLFSILWQRLRRLIGLGERAGR